MGDDHQVSSIESHTPKNKVKLSQLGKIRLYSFLTSALDAESINSFFQRALRNSRDSSIEFLRGPEAEKLFPRQVTDSTQMENVKQAMSIRHLTSALTYVTWSTAIILTAKILT